MKRTPNYRLIGVLMALGGLLLMPIFTVFTIGTYFLEIYGFPPIIPAPLKELNWRFFILVGATAPFYLLLITLIWLGFRKIQDPSLDIIAEIKRYITKLTGFVKIIAQNQ